MEYRKEIEGLRALGLLFVLLFHINHNFFPGGYLVVDVFFVISGYVITQSLVKDFKKNGEIDFFKKNYNLIFGN